MGRKLLFGAVGGPAGLVLEGASNDHYKANEFVQSYQNPFHEDIGKIIAPITEARTAGTLNYQQLTDAQAKLEERISKFQFDSDQYAITGGDQMKVVQQAREKLNPIMDAWRGTFKEDEKRLAPKLELPEVPTLQSILAGKPQAAAKRIHKTSPLSSILTGFKGTTGTTTKKTSAVGY